jgi:hypothetical protein
MHIFKAFGQHILKGTGMESFQTHPSIYGKIIAKIGLKGMKMSCSKKINFGFSLSLFGVNNNICMEHKN